MASLGETPQLFVPVSMKETLAAGWEQTYTLDNRRGRWLHLLGRLKPGASLQQAQASLEPLFASLIEYDLEQPEMAEVGDYRREQYRKARISVLPGAQGVSSVRDRARVPLWILMGMVGLLLLIACVNVANLMMTRAEARLREIAVRLALGAGRGRIVRQLMAECLMLAAVGGALAVPVAAWTSSFLIRLIDDPDITSTLSAQPDPRMLAFAAAVSAFTAVLFGLTPALRSVRVRVASALKSQSGSIAGGGVRLRKALVTAQVCLSLVLLIGAGLMWRSLISLGNVESGYEIERVVVFGIDPPRNGLDREQSKALLRDLRARIASLPGVEDAGYSLVRMLADDRWDTSVDVIGYEEQPDENVQVWVNAASPGYFSTMGVPIAEGRDFRESDRGDHAGVMIVNRAFADYFFKGASAIGRRIQGDGEQTVEIVGVIPNVRYGDLRDEIPRQMYFPYDAFPYTLAAHLHARTKGDPEPLIAALRSVAQDTAPNLPLYDLRTMEAQVATTLQVERVLATLGGAFGALAALLAGVGLYGVLAFSITRRTREIGLRIALGAQRGDVTWLAMREVLLLFLLGAALAVPASYGLGRLVESQLYGVSAFDLLTLGAATAFLAVVAVASALAPARRAARIQPMTALRFE